ncbi:hypothetical protein BD769DRAFT_1715016 [Suillus cothurnatus]|nr:hypothetical protein BD769DRAFT_1715016 [Suillus cothurnatus]
MRPKRKFHSTFGSVQETVILDSGTSKTIRANLTKIREDRIRFERENHELHEEISMKARQVLAEAAIHARPSHHPGDLAVSFDYGDASTGQMETDGSPETTSSDEEDDGDEDTPMASRDGQAVTTARAHVIACIRGSRRRRRAPRSRLLRNRQMHAAWHSQMSYLVDTYLKWKHGYKHDKPVIQAHEELANVSLLKLGFLGCSPLQPTVAVSLHCLELYHQIRRRKPSFSIQAMVKVLCALHNTYFQSLRDQFAIAFDVYLGILRSVKSLVDEALQRNSVNWRMLHACPPCNYKQPGEPLLYPARLDSFDGNNSLKRIDGSGHADERLFESSYFIHPADIELFKDDVRLRPGTRLAPESAQMKNSEVSHTSSCTENWKAANAVTEKTIDVFDQTGVFVSACRHGIIQTVVEMRRSGELAKYALATANKLMDVYGSDGVTGYDIGCSFTKTAAASSIAMKVKNHNHRFVVNSFHGHAHNRRCQLQFHTLYQQGLGIEDLETCERVFSGSNAVAPVIRHASYFHWLQFIDLHFDQWDQDRYQELSQFMYQNYKQALDIINNLTPVVEELKTQLKITDADFERWNIEELEYLQRLSTEQEYDPQKIAYVEALQSLTKAEAEYGGVTSVQFLSYIPTDFTQTSGLRKEAQVMTKAREAERQAAHNKLLLAMNVVSDLEQQLSIETRWSVNDAEYKQASAYLTNQRFIRAVDQLEGLVVQRLFELAKANLAGTGYKMRQQISNAITRRSTAIRNALERYNRLAPLQMPPRDMLKFSEVASYAWLGEFEMLKHSRCEILDKPWVSKANREVAGKYFRIVRAREEIHRLNIEISRLQTWVDTEDARLLEISTALTTTNTLLASEIQMRYEERRRMNNLHRIRLQAIYNLHGYSGDSVEQGNGLDEDQPAVLEELRGADLIEVDEDDTLCDEADRLQSCIS